MPNMEHSWGPSEFPWGDNPQSVEAFKELMTSLDTDDSFQGKETIDFIYALAQNKSDALARISVLVNLLPEEQDCFGLVIDYKDIVQYRWMQDFFQSCKDVIAFRTPWGETESPWGDGAESVSAFLNLITSLKTIESFESHETAAYICALAEDKAEAQNMITKLVNLLPGEQMHYGLVLNPGDIDRYRYWQDSFIRSRYLIESAKSWTGRGNAKPIKEKGSKLWNN